MVLHGEPAMASAKRSWVLRAGSSTTARQAVLRTTACDSCCEAGGAEETGAALSELLQENESRVRQAGGECSSRMDLAGASRTSAGQQLRNSDARGGSMCCCMTVLRGVVACAVVLQIDSGAASSSSQLSAERGDEVWCCDERNGVPAVLQWYCAAIPCAPYARAGAKRPCYIAASVVAGGGASVRGGGHATYRESNERYRWIRQSSGQ